MRSLYFPLFCILLQAVSGCFPVLKSASSSSQQSKSSASSSQSYVPGLYNLTDVPYVAALGNGGARFQGIDSSGNKVVYYSNADNWGGTDTNGANDVFIVDLTTKTTTRVSTNSAGAEVGGYTIMYGIGRNKLSHDGTKILFNSNSTGYVAGDTNGMVDCFMKDLVTGTTTRVSTDSVGAQLNNNTSECFFLTPTDDKVVFMTFATNAVAGDTNGQFDVFVKDLGTGAVTRVSTNGANAELAGGGYLLDYSHDGNYVLFSTSTAIAGGDTNGGVDIYMKNLTTSAVTWVSTATGGAVATGGSVQNYGAFNHDDTKVVFSATFTTLVAGDTNGFTDVFVKDLLTNVTTRVSLDSVGTQGNGVSGFGLVGWAPDGINVFFNSAATNLMPGDTNGLTDCFIKNTSTLDVTLLNATSTGAFPGSGNCQRAGYSDDGAKIFFDNTSLFMRVL